MTLAAYGLLALAIAFGVIVMFQIGTIKNQEVRINQQDARINELTPEADKVTVIEQSSTRPDDVRNSMRVEQWKQQRGYD